MSLYLYRDIMYLNKEMKNMNNNLEKVIKFLDEAEIYYLATIEGDQPRVRPFGTALIYEDKLYIQTGKIKPVSHQLHNNPKAEICAYKDGRWIRISGELIEDDRREIKTLMLEKMPSLRYMYNEDDGNMEMLHFRHAHVTISSFTEAPISFEI